MWQAGFPYRGRARSAPSAMTGRPTDPCTSETLGERGVVREEKPHKAAGAGRVWRNGIWRALNLPPRERSVERGSLNLSPSPPAPGDLVLEDRVRRADAPYDRAVEAQSEIRFPSRAAADAVGAPLAEWEAVATRGYARSCAHWRARLADGRRVFIKHALTATAVEWLRAERVIYEAVRGPFMPSFFGAYDDGELALIALEDLSAAEWPPPWSPSRIESVLASLDALHQTAAPAGIGKLDAIRAEVVGWPDVATNPEPLLSTGLCAPSWLEEALPELLQASEDARLDGRELLHFDVRSDNLCLRDGQALLFDWNLARVGNGDFDVAFWLPSLTLEGGPPPWEVLPDAGPLAAAVAGFFAVRAGLPRPTTAPTVRDFQRAQAQVALTWTARELDLPLLFPSA
jgi:hypothetical protein